MIPLFRDKEVVTSTRNILGTAVKLNLLFRKRKMDVGGTMRVVPPYTKKLFDFDMDLWMKIITGAWTDPEKMPDVVRERYDLMKVEKEMNSRKIFWTQEIFKNRDILLRLQQGFVPQANLLTFESFREIAANLFFQIAFYVLEHDMQEVLNGKEEMRLNFYAIDRYAYDDWCEYDERTSTLASLDFMFSGAFFLGRVYTQWIYLQKFDSAAIQKDLVHEFGHYLKDMHKYYEKEYAQKDAIIAFMKENPRKWLGSAVTVNTMLFNMYSEGYDTFCERQNARTVAISVPYLESAKQLMEKIAGTGNKVEANRLWDEVLTPTSDTGEYYFGSLMCYCIGLSIMHSKRPNCIIQLDRQASGDMLVSFKDARDPKKIQLPFNQLNGFLAHAKKAYLEQLTPDVIDATKQELGNLHHYDEFIARFEQACQELGFTKPVKFFDLAFVRRLEDIARKKVKLAQV